jgi:hypothetical protein
MSDRSHVLAAACVGAAIGGIWGWLYMTERGRRFRDRVDPTIDRLLDAVGQARATEEKARSAFAGGRVLKDVTGDTHAASPS